MSEKEPRKILELVRLGARYILKTLDEGGKTSYSSLREGTEINLASISHRLLYLRKMGLITKEEGEKDIFFDITQKGRESLGLYDQLVEKLEE